MSNELVDTIKPKEGFKSNLILHFLIPAVIVVVINIGTYVIMGTAKTLEGFVLAVTYQAIVLLIQKAFNIREMIQVATEGIKSVVSAILILSLAYCINAISQDAGYLQLRHQRHRELDDPRDPAGSDLRRLRFHGLLHRHQLGRVRHHGPHRDASGLQYDRR